MLLLSYIEPKGVGGGQGVGWVEGNGRGVFDMSVGGVRKGDKFRKKLDPLT